MPTTISELLGAFAAPLAIRHRGKVYKASAMTLRFKSEVERFLEDRDRRPVLDVAGEVAPGVLAHALAPHEERLAASAFRWGGPVHLDWVRSFDGAMEFSGLVLCVGSEEELAELSLERAAEVGLVVRQIVAEGLPPGQAARVRGARPEAPPQDNIAEAVEVSGDNGEVVALVAALLGEPWHRSIGEIAELTDRQLVQLYGHARDDKGRVKTRGEGRSPMVRREPVVRGSDEEARDFFTSSKMFGVPRAKAEAQWLEKRGLQPPATPWYQLLAQDWK